MTNAGDLSWCLACPVGLYFMEATVVPDACKVGTYQNVTGAGDPSECFTCPWGYVCVALRLWTRLCARTGHTCRTRVG